MMRNEMLIKAREQRGWTQEVAAEKIGVSRVAYARWEEQGILPRLWSITKASTAFNMTPEQLGLIKHTSSTMNSYVPVAPVFNDGTTGAAEMLRTGMAALALAWQGLGCTFDELQTMIAQELRSFDMLEHSSEKQVARRDVLRFLVGLPVALSGFTSVDRFPALPAEEALPLFISGIHASWKLYFDGGMAEVERVLPGYLAQLTTLVDYPSTAHKIAAGYTSQAHQLGYLIALQHQDFSVAQMHAKQAFEYASIADDPHLRMASLIRQGNLAFTLRRPVQTVQKYQEAVQHINNASPLLTGQAYIGLAEAEARLGRKQEALRLRGLAQDIFPEHPEQDGHFAYTHFNHFTRTNFEGLMYLHLDQPKEAWQTFAKIDQAIPVALIPQRVELLSRQAMTSVALKDMDQSCTYVDLTVSSARKLGSDLRYNEACETYIQMQALWPHEKRVKELTDLFRQA